MRIQKARIHNYRCIADLEVVFQPLMILIGPNNHGKSNILNALDFALNSGSKPDESDLFSMRPTNDDTLWVEITFSDLTAQESNTFRKYVLRDGKIVIRKTANFSSGSLETAYNGYVEEPDVAWLKSDAIGDLSNRDAVNETPLKDYVPAKGRLTKAHIEEAQANYIREHRESLKFDVHLESGPLLGRKVLLAGFSLTSILYPRFVT